MKDLQVRTAIILFILNLTPLHIKDVRGTLIGIEFVSGARQMYFKRKDKHLDDDLKAKFSSQSHFI